MTLPKPTREQLLASIRKRLDQGFITATAERIKSLAANSDDPELLREMTNALVDSITNPSPPKRGAPRKSVRPSEDCVYNVDDMPAFTKAQTAELVKAMAREYGICEKIYVANKRKRTAIVTLCQTHGIGTDTYYKWFPADS